jgi:predicted metal-dependent hydrolase
MSPSLLKRREAQAHGAVAMHEYETIPLQRGEARVAWKRHPRARRVSLRIDPRAGSVVITLPRRGSRRAGMDLLMTHAAWVEDRLAALPDAVPFIDGAWLPVDDMPRPIRHVPGARSQIADDQIVVGGEPAFLARRVSDLLRAEMRRRLVRMSHEKAALVGRAPRRVTVKDTVSRWGSCAPDGALAYSWRLIFAPPAVQDYVAAHEVAHLVHMNHGPRFWALVRTLTPHTGAAVDWLRREGPRLMRYG